MIVFVSDMIDFTRIRPANCQSCLRRSLILLPSQRYFDVELPFQILSISMLPTSSLLNHCSILHTFRATTLYNPRGNLSADINEAVWFTASDSLVKERCNFIALHLKSLLYRQSNVCIPCIPSEHTGFTWQGVRLACLQKSRQVTDFMP